MRTENTRRALLAGLLTLAAGAAACVTSSPEYPEPMKLTTRPPGAQVELVRRGIVLVTPCTFPESFRTYEPIVVRKAGYLPFEGTLQDLPQVARLSYELTLEREGE